MSQSGNARQRQAEETRLHLLSAAVEAFKERGYHETSVGTITDRANTAHGTFYLYFGSKEDAFCQVMEAVYDELEVVTGARLKVVDPNASSRQVLEQLLRGFLEAYVPHHGLWRAVVEGAFRSQRVHEMWLKRRRVLVDSTIMLLQAGQAGGTVRSLDPVVSGNALAAMVEWFVFMEIELKDEPTTGPEIEKVSKILADLWYHAASGKVPDQPGSPD